MNPEQMFIFLVQNTELHPLDVGVGFNGVENEVWIKVKELKDVVRVSTMEDTFYAFNMCYQELFKRIKGDRGDKSKS